MHYNISLHPLKNLLQGVEEGDPTYGKANSWIEHPLKKQSFETSCETEENNKYFLQDI